MLIAKQKNQLWQESNPGPFDSELSALLLDQGCCIEAAILIICEKIVSSVI